MFDNLRGDFVAVRDANIQPGWWQRHRWSRNLRALSQFTFPAVVVYRFGHWVEGLSFPVVSQVLWIVAAILRRFVAVWTGIYIMPRAEIGPGLIIHTWVGGVGVGAVKIGANCTLNGGVQIMNGVLEIGDNVYFGAGVVVADDVRIGNDVVIMPNSLVLTDVADNTTTVGVPARIKLCGGRPKMFRSALSKERRGPVAFRSATFSDTGAAESPGSSPRPQTGPKVG
jgi:serine acetyltransferase